MGRTKFQRFQGIRKRRKNRTFNVERAIEESGPTDGDETASSKKLALFDLELEKMIEKKQSIEEMKVDNERCFLIADKLCLKKLISSLCCPYCKHTGVIFETHKGEDMGFCNFANLYCKLCDTVIRESYLSERIKSSQPGNSTFEVNVRSAFAFMGLGCGYNAMRDWTGMMNIPSCPNKKPYHSSKDKLLTGSKETFQETAKQSVDIIRSKYAEIGVMPDKDGILDIAVSYDGTWQRRGGGVHSSHNGAGAVIDLLTGLPLDYEILCNCCHQCLKGPKPEQPEYQDWREKYALKCSKTMKAHPTQ